MQNLVLQIQRVKLNLNLAKIKKGTVTSDDVTAVIVSFGEENGIPFKQQITTEQKNEKVGKGKEYASVTELIDALDSRSKRI